VKLSKEYIAGFIDGFEDHKYDEAKAEIYSKLRVLNKRGLAETK